MTAAAKSPRNNSAAAWLPAGLAFGLPLLIYGLTLAPTIYNLDSAELTTAAATGGLARATGYPLYLLLGRLWSLLPLGDIGFRMNLLSAVCGALTIGLTERILRRLGAGPWARLGALGLLATAPFFWALSLVAEVYTLHTALMAGFILLILRWAERPTSGRLGAASAVLGLGLANHAATVLLLPGAAVFWWSQRRPANLRQVAAGLAQAAPLLLGLALYLYLPLLSAGRPAFNYAGAYDAQGVFRPVDLSTPAGLGWLVSGQAFSGQMFAYDLAEMWAEVGEFGRQLWATFLAVGLGPGILGAFVLLRRNGRFGLFLLLLFGANAFFYINYRVIDKNTMFLPVYLVWALWVGVGYQSVLDVLAAESGGRRWALPWLGRAIILAAAAAALVYNWPRVDQSGDWSARQRGQAILDRVAPGALLLGWWDTVPVVEYLQLVEGRRPDVTAINRFLIAGDDMEILIRNELPQRPVYINNPPTSLLRSYDAVRVGPVYRLLPRAPAVGSRSSG
ncbi:MAG: protein O-mannosyl-transferase family [Candidatus Promineifilaceae bacterium]